MTIFPRRERHAEVPSANNNIIYRIYIYIFFCSPTTTRRTIIISWQGRSEYPPARGHTSETDFTPTPWEEHGSSQHFDASQNPAIPPYYIKTPHCMAPRRWRIHFRAGYAEHDGALKSRKVKSHKVKLHKTKLHKSKLHKVTLHKMKLLKI